MRLDFEERLVLNPLLGAVLLWSFVSEYERRASGAPPPDLILILPVLPIVLHQASTAKLKGMQFDSGLAKAIAESPAIRGGLGVRLASYAPLTFRSLSLACASKLLAPVADRTPPAFRVEMPRIPVDLRPQGVTNDMAKAARRLGAFFLHSTLSEIQSLLGISL